MEFSRKTALDKGSFSYYALAFCTSSSYLTLYAIVSGTILVLCVCLAFVSQITRPECEMQNTNGANGETQESISKVAVYL